ncbi:host-nuclease inhibitor Gam family protein [Citromicrobium bathyomarinum]|uniref:host-nuclease inhibitor Gam family protein n=1 Tax=Citromicrobium bathyomarinum TaxID=72174 RepID=UPI003159D7E5
MVRRKQESVHVPANKAEAEDMVAEFTELDRQRLLERLAADEAIDRVKAQCAEAVAVIDAEMQPIFAGLQAWWEAGGKEELAKGKRSANLGHAKIGIRLSTPSLKFRRGTKAAEFLDWLLSLRLAGKAKFLRVPKTQLDRNAIIKEMRTGGPVADSFAKAGAVVEQTDEFFIDTGLDVETVRKESAAS